jgi:selenium metabolism protein YedF
MKELDVRTLACPGPVLQLKKLFEEGEAAVRLRVADELARSNVTRFAASRGASASSEPADDGSFVVTVTERDAVASSPGEGTREASGKAAAKHPVSGPRVVQVGSDRMGEGDDELGALLLRSFLKTQAQLETKPGAILFYNAGVKLCCEGSPLVDDLRGLEAEGIEIIACGTCLNYFELAERLAVGRVTDMLEIATRLGGAGAAVRP